MAPRTETVSDDDVAEKARKRIERAWERDAENRDEGRIDLRYVAGIQWTPEEIKARVGRPSLTFNRLTPSLYSIANELRQNQPAIKCQGTQERSDEDDDLAEVFTGLVRDIEQRSNAGYVYAATGTMTAACGISAMRVCTEYVDDGETDDQHICIEPIMDPFAVYWDPDATKPDRSDAKWCAVLEVMSLESFEEEYPEADPDSIELPDANRTGLAGMVWKTDDTVTVAEYWERRPVKRHIVRYQGDTLDITGSNRKVRNQWQAAGGSVREVTTYEVRSWIVAGNQVLSGPHEWAGKYLPVVACVGTEVPIGEGKTVRFGMIRGGRDPQKLYNFWRSAAAEAIGQAPKSPWLATAGMIAKYKDLWNKANTENLPYLLYEPDKAAPGGRPERIAPPATPSALWQESAQAADDIKATTGIFDASLGAQGNETSGKAILARQREGDATNFHYLDNLRGSVEQVGRIIVDLIPRIYDTERVVRILGEDGSERTVTINKPMPAEDEGVRKIANDLSRAKMEVMAKVGPSYASKKAEALEGMIQFTQAVPNAGALIGDLIAKNAEWPGAEEIAARLKKALPPGFSDEQDDEDAQPAPGVMPPEQPGQPPAQPDLMQAQQDQQQAAADAQQQMMSMDLQLKQLEVERAKLMNMKLMVEIEKLQHPPAPTAPARQMNGAAPNGIN